MKIIILIHKVRTGVGPGLEPVGIWAIQDDSERHYYPSGNEKYEARGYKALFEHPSMLIGEWALYKADTSPNWQVHHPVDSLLFDAPEPDLSQIFDDMHSKFLESVKQKQSHIRAQHRQQENQPGADNSPWGARPDILANSWWIASQLVRRHPQLLAYEMHPAGGMHDILAIAPPEKFSARASPSQSVAMLNRAGTLQVHGGDRRQTVAEWDQVRDPKARDECILAIEAATGWGTPTSTPSSTPRSLAYRFLASALELFVNDRAGWDARCEFLDTSDFDEGDPGLIGSFPTAMADLRTIEPLGIYGEPLSHFWALLRGGEAMLIVSVEGRIYRRNGASLDLMAEYQKHGRRIRWMTASLLREWL